MQLFIRLYHHEGPEKPMRMSSNCVSKINLYGLTSVAVLVIEKNEEDRLEFYVRHKNSYEAHDTTDYNNLLHY